MNGSVIVPLYVFPSMGAWAPVYDMYATLSTYYHVLNSDSLRAETYPQVQFTAVVNIQSGPGDGALPSNEYWEAIETLNSLNNVRTIGYVATTWCERNLSQVLDEIAAYSFWGEYDSSLAIDGIFVDETPTQYSSDYVEYLHSVSQAVQNSPGLDGRYIGKVAFLLISATYCAYDCMTRRNRSDPWETRHVITYRMITFWVN